MDINQLFDVSGKVVCMTGASSGLGRLQVLFVDGGLTAK